LTVWTSETSSITVAPRRLADYKYLHRLAPLSISHICNLRLGFSFLFA
jgi:hypothetical protein